MAHTWPWVWLRYRDIVKSVGMKFAERVFLEENNYPWFPLHCYLTNSTEAQAFQLSLHSIQLRDTRTHAHTHTHTHRHTHTHVHTYTRTHGGAPQQSGSTRGFCEWCWYWWICQAKQREGFKHGILVVESHSSHSTHSTTLCTTWPSCEIHCLYTLGLTWRSAPDCWGHWRRHSWWDTAVPEQLRDWSPRTQDRHGDTEVNIYVIYIYICIIWKKQYTIYIYNIYDWIWQLHAFHDIVSTSPRTFLWVSQWLYASGWGAGHGSQPEGEIDPSPSGPGALGQEE